MSRGLTIAELVQQVLYAMYKVRLDVDASKQDAYHSKSDKFKEIVMEANFMLQEFQKEQDWNFLRERWEIGLARNPVHGIQEFEIPEGIYKLCTGYNDAVRLHYGHGEVLQIPYDSPRSGNHAATDMYDQHGFLNVDKNLQRAFVVGDTLSFYRRWHPGELNKFLETDVISYIEPLHICDETCSDNCPKAYNEKLFKWMPDPYYFVVRTAARRALADPSCAEIAQSLTDEASKFLSAVRENDSAHTNLDTYETSPLGYISVL
jgi:hypothetical protein